MKSRMWETRKFGFVRVESAMAVPTYVREIVFNKKNYCRVGDVSGVKLILKNNKVLII